MTIASDIEEMHGMARTQLALARMDGHGVDKRVARYGEIVECAARYAVMSGKWRKGVALAGLKEAIDCCIKGDEMHTGQSCMTLAPDWMIPPTGRAILARHFP